MILSYLYIHFILFFSFRIYRYQRKQDTATLFNLMQKKSELDKEVASGRKNTQEAGIELSNSFQLEYDYFRSGATGMNPFASANALSVRDSQDKADHLDVELKFKISDGVGDILKD